MTFWERLEAELEFNGLTETELSRRLGVAPSVINSWKTRGSMPRADIACKTAKTLNTTVEYLIDGNHSRIISEKNSYLVPVINQDLSAGKGCLVPEDDSLHSFIELPSFFKQFGKDISGLFVNGDSMSPTLKNGTLVIVTPTGWDKGEGLFAIRLNGDGYVKRLQVVSGKILIISDNPKYKTIEEPIDSENLQIIGRVIGKIEYDLKGL